LLAKLLVTSDPVIECLFSN